MHVLDSPPDISGTCNGSTSSNNTIYRMSPTELQTATSVTSSTMFTWASATTATSSNQTDHHSSSNLQPQLTASINCAQPSDYHQLNHCNYRQNAFVSSMNSSSFEHHNSYNDIQTFQNTSQALKFNLSDRQHRQQDEQSDVQQQPHNQHHQEQHTTDPQQQLLTNQNDYASDATNTIGSHYVGYDIDGQEFCDNNAWTNTILNDQSMTNGDNQTFQQQNVPYAHMQDANSLSYDRHQEQPPLQYSKSLNNTKDYNDNTLGLSYYRQPTQTSIQTHQQQGQHHQLPQPVYSSMQPTIGQHYQDLNHQLEGRNDNHPDAQLYMRGDSLMTSKAELHSEANADSINRQFDYLTEEGLMNQISGHQNHHVIYCQDNVSSCLNGGEDKALYAGMQQHNIMHDARAGSSSNTSPGKVQQDRSGADEDHTFDKGRSPRGRRGRPRKKGLRTKNKVNGKLWEFIRDLLLSERTNPSFIRWERREDGVFKFVQSDKVAKMWGERKQNPKMTYEKLSRAMRYYYKSKVLLPVFGRRLVYKFGPNATGWLPRSPYLK